MNDVYEFLFEPLNLPTWTAGIERIEHRRDSDWVATTADGEVIFRYPRRNDYGVLDFTLWRRGEEQGRTMPVRVFPNGDGTEMTLTYFQVPGISDEVFASELEWIRTDVFSLRSLLETRVGRP